MAGVRALLCLGGFALDGVLRTLGRAGHRIPSPRPRFAHGRIHRIGGGAPPILCSYHPSQQNTFTGRLTPDMMDEILVGAARLLDNDPFAPNPTLDYDPVSS